MVEWKKLGEVTSIIRGKRVTKGELIDNGIYPVISGGVTPMGYIDSYNREPNTITISQYGTAGFVDYQHSRFWANDICYCVYPNNDLDNKYLWYVLKNKQDMLYAIRNTDAIPYSLPVETLNSVSIPIPTLSEQQRIVGILDTFTASIDNLKEQIAQRRKQYEYYRDQLLDLEGKPGVEIIELGELGSFFGGLSGKTKEDFVDGNAKFITYMNVFANPSLDVKTTGVVKINEGERQNKIQKGDILFTGSSETPDEAGMSCVVTDELRADYYLNSFCFGIRLDTPEQYNLHFLKHILRSRLVRKKIAQSASGVTRFNISKKRFAKITILLPSLREQQRIVTILDTFETSIQNLESQLTQREKQYEYYRNKLLTFE